MKVLSLTLTQNEAKFLLKIAREAITNFLESGIKINPIDIPPKFKEKFGVFVTLNKKINDKHELRGCIGYPQPIMNLIEATIDSAISAATRDPRFVSVSLEEMEQISVDISVLSLPELIKVKDPREYPKNIEVGKNGLIVERGQFKGLLLPQVPVEWGWDEEEFLSNCCMKAGLQPDLWLIKGTKIYKFSCIIVKELPEGEMEIIDMYKQKSS